MFLQRYCTFQRNEPCSLPVTVEMIAAYLNKTPEEIAIATTFNAHLSPKMIYPKKVDSSVC